jgi:hypothetical protein
MPDEVLGGVRTVGDIYNAVEVLRDKEVFSHLK